MLIDGGPGRIWCSKDSTHKVMLCKIEVETSRALFRIFEKVRRLFDMDAVPQDIQCQLQKDKLLAKLVRQNPGQRLPGCWDGFAIAVRAIVGQQIWVKGATTVMGVIAKKSGD